MKKRGLTPSPREGNDDRMRVGISSCLIGHEVRWDGNHKRDAFLTKVLGTYVEWVPVCPEVEVGMGIPREPVRLVTTGRQIRMLGVDSGRDWTAEMRDWAERRAGELAGLGLCGYVFKKGSPSCGIERVKVYDRSGAPSKSGRGLFAEALMRQQATLPVEEEGRLTDAHLRESFIERLFAYRRLRSLFAGQWNVGQLVAFHTQHKLQLMAHSPRAYTSLGQMVARAKRSPRDTFAARYEQEFMTALAERATARRHTNVLEHCLGYFRDRLDAKARREILSVVQDYRAGLVPLVVPITMIRHYVRTLDVGYLAGQVYLEPHPKELMLRNHV